MFLHVYYDSDNIVNKHNHKTVVIPYLVLLELKGLQ